MYKIFHNTKDDHEVETDLSDLIVKFDAKKILILTGQNSFSESKAENFLISELKDKYTKSNFYSDFENNPKIEDLNHAIQKLSSKEIELIIACGGGSVIDFAKLLKVYLYDASSILDFPGKYKNPSKSQISMIAIPTTAGTGSEATHFSVLYDNKKKYSIASDHMLPDYSVLNSSICLNASLKIKSSCVIDAFSQAIESFWSVGANLESIKFAKQAIHLINKHIDNFHINHKDENVMSDILLGAHYSGKAINISKTTAPHALSYSITSFFGIPHGHAVGMTLGEFFIINEQLASMNAVNCRDLSSHMLQMEALRELLGWGDCISCNDKWKSIMKNLGLNMQVKLNDGQKKVIDRLVDSVNTERLSNNPVSITKENIIKLYLNIIS